MELLCLLLLTIVGGVAYILIDKVSKREEKKQLQIINAILQAQKERKFKEKQ